MGKRGGWGERKRRMGDKGRRRSSVGEGGREGEGGGVEEIRLQQAARRGGESVAFPPRSPPGSFVPTPLHFKKIDAKAFIGEIQLFHSLCDTPPAKTNLYVLQAPNVRFFRFVWGIPGLIVSNFEVSVSKEARTLFFLSSKFQKRKEMPSFFFFDV